jgi:dCTP deaminase
MTIALRAMHAETPLVDGMAVIDEGLGFSVDLRLRDTTLVGYRAKPHTGVIDLDQLAHYDPSEFWEEVHSTNGQIILDPGAFYILVSREAVTIPPSAAEMAPYLAMVGEFRVHYAGFFDPGFGFAAAGGAGLVGCWKYAATKPPLYWNMHKW